MINKTFKNLIISDIMCINELTKIIDTKVKTPSEYSCTYIMHDKQEYGTFLLRYPGMTIGNFKTNESKKVTEIIIYNDSALLIDTEGINELVTQFIGWEFVTPFKVRQKKEDYVD